MSNTFRFVYILIFVGLGVGVVTTLPQLTMTMKNAVNKPITKQPFMSTTTCADYPNGLVGHWRGEGNVLDSVGGHTGAEVGSIDYAQGQVGQGFRLNGTNYVEIAHQDALNPVDKISVAAWISPSAPLSGYNAIVTKPGANLEGGYMLSYYGFQLNFFIAAFTFGAVNWYKSPAIPVPQGQWSYVVGVYDGSYIRAYLNGVELTDPTPFSSGIIRNNGPLQFGHDAYHTNSIYFYEGGLDEIQIYDRALTAEEVQQLYQRGLDQCQSFVFSKQASGNFWTGEYVTYTLALDNLTGPLDIESMVVTDTLPDYLAYQTGTLTSTFGIAMINSNVITWSGSVMKDTQVLVHYQTQITPLADKVITNIGHAHDTVKSYTATINSPIGCSAVLSSGCVKLTKEASGSLRPNTVLTYSLRVENLFDKVDISALVITDTLPASLSYISNTLTASVGTAVISNNVITWTGDVFSHTAVLITYTTRINASATGTINNTSLAQWYNKTYSATAVSNVQHAVYLPTITRNYCQNFLDDFSNPNSGWAVGEDDYLRTEYTGGEYRVYSKNGDYFYTVRSPSCARDNYVVETDVRWGGEPNFSYGLQFGITSDSKHYYLFEVYPDYQAYSLYRYDSGVGFTALRTPVVSGGVRTGNNTNHLKVTRNGTAITLQVNDTVLGTWYDGSISGFTRVGVTVNPCTDLPNADARFDNFRSTAIVSGGSSPVPPSVPTGKPVNLPKAPTKLEYVPPKP